MLLLLASMLEGLKGFASAQPIEVIGGGEVEYQRTVPFATAAKELGCMAQPSIIPDLNMETAI